MKILNVFKKNKKIKKEKIKTWFVTGASSGLGHELCEQLAQNGYNVIAIARRTPIFENKNIVCISADVTKVDEIENAINLGIEKFGEINVLVNNAGTSSYLTCEEELAEKMRSVMETNFWGAFNTIQILLPHFRKKNNGTIINVSSECGIIPRAFGAAYCSSKHALEGLSGVLWHETKRFCRVLTVELSFFKNTEIGKGEQKGSKLLEYSKIQWLPIKMKNSKNNDIKIATKFIIEEAEKEKMQRRLMLGEDIPKKIEFEINSLKNDLKLSKKRAELCAKGDFDGRIK